MILTIFHQMCSFPHKLLLFDSQVSRLCKAFASGSSANINSSKNHLSKIVQSGGLFGEIVEGVRKAMLLPGLEGIQREVKRVVVKKFSIIS